MPCVPAQLRATRARRIVAQTNPPIMQEARKLVGALEHIVDGLSNIVIARELDTLAFHPIYEIVDHRRDVFAAHSNLLARRQSVDRAFKIEYRVELLHRCKGDG